MRSAALTDAKLIDGHSAFEQSAPWLTAAALTDAKLIDGHYQHLDDAVIALQAALTDAKLIDGHPDHQEPAHFGLVGGPDRCEADRRTHRGVIVALTSVRRP